MEELRTLVRAIQSGVIDQFQLTDLIFYARHPELIGVPLTQDQQLLLDEWNAISALLVHPTLNEIGNILGANVMGGEVHGAQEIRWAFERAAQSPLNLGRTSGDSSRFDQIIFQSVQWCPGLSPAILKGLLAQESNFNPTVINEYGYAGIAQFGREAAREVGLQVGIAGSDMDERLNPYKAIPAAARLLNLKAQRLGDLAFSRYGQPDGTEFWKFVVAAYNGGEGTITVAMGHAYRDGLARANHWRNGQKLLRDLRSGAFLHPRDMEGPFALTGRARIVSEMMALIRTIEAIEKFAADVRANPNGSVNSDLYVVSRAGIIGGLIGADVAELFAQALSYSGPTIPGLAGRLEIPRLIAALGGILTDATGRPFIMADGTPLKLGELLWFNARADAAFDLWALDRFPTRLSPNLVHGFDAVYSVIGFDGPPLSLPRFMAIQSQINASEFEWLFGQAPLSEGWIRSAIEFLKDSVSFDHNVLGEMLEEAVTCGRFHLTVMRGTVEEGRAVSDSFSFTPVQNLNPALSPLA